MVAREISFPLTKINIPGSPSGRAMTTDHPVSSPTYNDTRDDNNRTTLGMITEDKGGHINSNIRNTNWGAEEHGEDNYEADDDGNNYAIKSMNEGLEIQREKYGSHHPGITKSLHSLALEYKDKGQYDKAMLNLNEAIAILEEKFQALVANDTVDSSQHDFDNDDISRSSFDSRFSAAQISINSMPMMSSSLRATANAQRQKLELLEEKSLLFSCLANIYRNRNMYKEAMDNYVKSMNMLVEAGYPGDSPRVVMLMRIMKRAEMNKRKQFELSHNQPYNIQCKTHGKRGGGDTTSLGRSDATA